MYGNFNASNKAAACIVSFAFKQRLPRFSARGLGNVQ